MIGTTARPARAAMVRLRVQALPSTFDADSLMWFPAATPFPHRREWRRTASCNGSLSGSLWPRRRFRPAPRKPAKHKGIRPVGEPKSLRRNGARPHPSFSGGLAREAVLIAPVSARKSLLTANFTGNFTERCPRPRPTALYQGAQSL